MKQNFIAFDAAVPFMDDYIHLFVDRQLSQLRCDFLEDVMQQQIIMKVCVILCREL
ncbi:hypothetical protein D3C71_2230200 [compost metagenome]